MRSTPMSRAVGTPHGTDSTAQDQEQFPQNRRIRYGLLHSVIRRSGGSPKGSRSVVELPAHGDDETAAIQEAVIRDGGGSLTGSSEAVAAGHRPR